MKNILRILLALLTGIAPSLSQLQFSGKIDFPVGEGPTSLAIGDLNGDGLTDIVTANYRANSISLLIGTMVADSSSPSFLQKRDLPAGENPMAVAVADLNGDGRPEIIAANYLSNSISVFVNTTPKGSKTPVFAARKDVPTGERPYWIAVADLNGDGKPDLIVVDYKSTAVSVFLNATAPGDSSFSLGERVDLPAQARPTSAAVADFNGDGKADIVVTNYRSDSLSLFLNETPQGALRPSFSRPLIFAAGTRPIAVAATDLNGDGRPDILVADDGANAVRVLMNGTANEGGEPSFEMKAELLTGLNPQFVYSTQLNNEAMPGVLAADYNSGVLSVFLNTTRRGDDEPSFSPRREVKTGTAPSSIAVGPRRGVPGEILYVANYGSNSVSVIVFRSGAGE